MRRAHVLHLLRSVAWSLLAAGVASCSDDDPGPVEGTATVMGVFRDAEGNPMAGAPVSIFVLDTLYETSLENRSITTNAAGEFHTTFAFSPETFPVRIQVRAHPPLGSGMNVVQEDTVVFLPPGRLSDTLTYALNAVQYEPPVNDIPPASFAQRALLGHYAGKSVAPLLNWVIAYLELDVTGTAGSVSGRYDIYYNATTTEPDGTILGAVLLDTLRLQLTSDSTPGQPRNVASLKAIATSSTADTLVATPDPCTAGGCWLFEAPILLIRAP